MLRQKFLVDCWCKGEITLVYFSKGVSCFSSYVEFRTEFFNLSGFEIIVVRIATPVQPRALSAGRVASGGLAGFGEDLKLSEALVRPSTRRQL